MRRVCVMAKTRKRRAKLKENENDKEKEKAEDDSRVYIQNLRHEDAEISYTIVLGFLVLFWIPPLVVTVLRLRVNFD
jgi:hypothetical protein